MGGVHSPRARQKTATKRRKGGLLPRAGKESEVEQGGAESEESVEQQRESD